MLKKITSIACSILIATTLIIPVHANNTAPKTRHVSFAKTHKIKKYTAQPKSAWTQACDQSKKFAQQIQQTLSSLNKTMIMGGTMLTASLYWILFGSPDTKTAKITHTSYQSGAGIPADQFFKLVTGLSESEFRSQLGWDESLGRLTKVPTDTIASFNVWRDQWIDQNGNRFDIFKSVYDPLDRTSFTPHYSFETIADIERNIRGPISPVCQNSGTPIPAFHILLHDPKNPHKTDITHLQAEASRGRPRWLFQVASTLRGPLEGGMHAHSAYLTDMLHSPVQGELASISAAGAAIFRKYFMPTIRFIQRTDKTEQKAPPLYTLFDVTKSHMPHKNNVSLFTDHRACVSCTVTINRASNRHTLCPVEDGQATIAQVFTSAIDLSHYNGNVPLYEQKRAAELLKLEYLGTLKKAYDLKRPFAVLTMVGGGAFKNDISWIQNAITNPELIKFIKDTGLNVSIVYRPDNPRRAKPVRDAQGDKTFLRALYAVADEVNGTRVAEETIKSPEMQQYFKYIDHTYAQATEKPTRMILP